MAIIGVLIAIVLSSVQEARKEARDTQRITDIRKIQTALELAYSDNGAYPISGWVCSHESSWESGVLGTALEKYLPDLPTDPVNESGFSYNGSYAYCYFGRNYPSGTPNGSGKWYMLVFALERADVILDQTTGVTACDGSQFPYGGSEDGLIIDVGGDCTNFASFD